jgi:hypothetical protein
MLAPSLAALSSDAAAAAAAAMAAGGGANPYLQFQLPPTPGLGGVGAPSPLLHVAALQLQADGGGEGGEAGGDGGGDSSATESGDGGGANDAAAEVSPALTDAAAGLHSSGLVRQ